MSASIQLFIILLILFLWQHVVALNILAIISMPMRSHHAVFRPLFRELAARGHNVTVMNNFPDKKSSPNLKFIDLQAYSYNNTAYSRHPLESYDHVDSNIKLFLNIYEHTVTKLVKRDCETLFTNKNAKAHYAEKLHYDVIFVEQFISDCGLAYAAALYDAPIIGITSHTLQPWSYSRLGLPFNIAADAFYFSNVGPNPPLIHKVQTALIIMFLNTFGKWKMQSSVYEAFSNHLPEYRLDVEEIGRQRMKMMFVNQHFSVTGSRALPPQVLEIGGIHVGTPERVAPDVEDFLADAKNGAVYVSFGSNLKANTMSAKKLQEFLTAFNRLPYKIIWKYENATFTKKNIFTGNWFSQLDILCHPKVLAFVSHGGMLSLAESTHCGKPILTVPFFGDQFSNSAAARHVGIGKTLFFDKLNADTLEEGIRELLSPEMQQNAKRVSSLWHDRPMPVMDSAIYWTEYVARHKSAPPSLPAKHNTWFEGLLIDVAIAILAIFISLVLAVYTIIKFVLLIIFFIYNKLFGRKTRKIESRGKSKKGKRE